VKCSTFVPGCGTDTPVSSSSLGGVVFGSCFYYGDFVELGCKREGMIFRWGFKVGGEGYLTVQ
jgi:hypothetical protein